MSEAIIVAIIERRVQFRGNFGEREFDTYRSVRNLLAKELEREIQIPRQMLTEVNYNRWMFLQGLIE